MVDGGCIDANPMGSVNFADKVGRRHSTILLAAAAHHHQQLASHHSDMPFVRVTRALETRRARRVMLGE
jgi:hypothetical protein